MLPLFGIGQVPVRIASTQQTASARIYRISPVETESLFDRSYESLHVGVVVWRGLIETPSEVNQINANYRKGA